MIAFFHHLKRIPNESKLNEKKVINFKKNRNHFSILGSRWKLQLRVGPLREQMRCLAAEEILVQSFEKRMSQKKLQMPTLPQKLRP